VVIGALGGGMKNLMSELSKILTKNELVTKIAGEMQKGACG